MAVVTTAPAQRSGASSSGPASAGAGARRPRATRATRPVSPFLKVGAVLAVLGLWHLVAASGVVASELPGPVDVAEAMVGLWGTAEYWNGLAMTLRTWALGFALCCVIGIPAGLLIGVSVRATRSTRWIIDFFRTIPTIALLPLFLLLFGATQKMEITMIVAAAVWPLLIQSMYAAREVEPLLKWVCRVYRISRRDRLAYLWAPSVALFVSTGMRLAATMALLMTISAEYIGGAPGLGRELSLTEQALQRPEVFAYAITGGVLGLLINIVVVRAQRRVLWWHPVVRGERSA
jgi:ABC-type nitrate/sulfonate/bicarbonate transport system permease component